MSEPMPEYFYLYLSLKDFGLRKLIAFLAGKLPLTSPTRFNDPFDAKLSLDHSNHNPPFTPYEQKAVDDGWHKETIQWHKQQMLEQDWQKKYSGCCFSERWDSLLMWSHYADAHRGFCLQFKYDLAKEPTGCFFKPVRYSSHYPKIDASRVSEIEETLLLTKSTDWMYENEWRFVAPSAEHGTKDGFDGLLEQSPFSLQQIYFGAYCNSMEFLDDEERAERILGKEMVQKISNALDEFYKVYPDPQRTPEAGQVIFNALDELKISKKEDTYKQGEVKEHIAQSILTELINNFGMTVQLKKSDDAFRLVEVD